MDHVANSAGAADTAFGVMSEGLEFQKGKFFAAMKDIQYSVAEFLIPIILKAKDIVVAAFRAIADFVQKYVRPIWDEVFEVMRKRVQFIIDIANSFKEVFSQVVEALMPTLQNLGKLVLEEVLPAIWDFYNLVNEKIMQALTNLANFIVENVVPVVVEIAGAVTGLLVAAFEALVYYVQTALMPIFTEIYNFVKDNLVAGFQVVSDFVTETVLPVLSDLVSMFSLDFLGAIEGATEYLEGDFLRVIDDVATNMSELWGTFKELAKFIGEKLVEAITWLVETLSIKLQPVIEDVTKFFNEDLKPAIDDIAEAIREKWIPFFQTVIDIFNEHFMPVLRGFVEFLEITLLPVLKFIAEIMMDVVVAAFQGLLDILRGVLDFIVGIFTLDLERAFGGITKIFDGALQIILAVPLQIIEAFAGLLVDLVQWGAELGMKLINSIVDSIKNAASKVAGAVKDVVTGALNNIPGAGLVKNALGFVGFAEGGIVTRPTMGLVGEAGPEAIIPLDKLRGGGLGGTVNNITIKVEGGLDSAEAIGERVEAALTKWRSHKGTLDFEYAA